MRVKTYIHDDRSHFDLYVQLLHELGSNHLIMNIKVRVKPDGTSVFVPLFELRRINFCEFLSEYRSNPVMKFMFKKNINLNDIIVCPVRVGNYSLLDSDVAGNMQTQGIQNGTYKFFAEIVEEIGEIAKVFALQVTSMVYIVDKELECQTQGTSIKCV